MKTMPGLARRARATLLLGLLFFCALSAKAAPFAKKFQFTQPGGQSIELWGEGDEFHAVFETLDGYTVVFDPNSKAYHYAQLSADSRELVPTTWQVGRDDPAATDLNRHLRISPAATKEKARTLRERWEETMQVRKRWTDLKAKRQSRELAAATLPTGLGRSSPPTYAPPAYTTTGTKLGLTLLIDFSDDPGTIPQAEIEAFCNGDDYSGSGNNGSVKKYFHDNSNGLLIYSNVVTAYIRMAYPKSHYNDITEDCGVQGNLLLHDALDILKADSNYETLIKPAFADLTVDANNFVVACNVFFAGDNSGVWSKGLWPHSWALIQELGGPVSLNNGKSVFYYQITDLGSSLELGTFCHENGHMLCDFPDIYDYDYDSVGGAGSFCLMNSGGHGVNPVQICAYLKYTAGWATVTELTKTSILTGSLTASAGPAFNHFYKFSRPGISTEYYLMENRQKTGRDALLPSGGIAVWHVDELGDKDNQNLFPNTTHDNYEVTLIQADNQWHFQKYVNSGDANDLYFSGNAATSYKNALSDSSWPAARWYDGSSTGLFLTNFSAAGATMTFDVRGPWAMPAPVVVSEPAVTVGAHNTIDWSEGSFSAPALPPEPVVITRTASPPRQITSVNPNTAATASTRLAAPATISPGIRRAAPPKTSSSSSRKQRISLLDASKSPQNSPNLSLLQIAPGPIRMTRPDPSDFPALWDTGLPPIEPATTTTITDQSFEGSFPPSGWALSGSPTWGRTDIEKNTGTYSAWCAGSSRVPADGYANNMDARLYYGTFDLSDATAAELRFYLKNNSEPGRAFFQCFVFVGSNYGGYQFPNSGGEWDLWTIDFTNLYNLGNVCGQSEVLILFRFISDGSGSGLPYTGAFLDDVVIEKTIPEPTDLQVTEFALQTGSPTEEGSFWVQARIYNAGPYDAPASHAKLFLSTDNDTDFLDDYPANEAPVNALAVGASELVQWDFTLPNIGIGSYSVWPVVLADSGQEVDEVPAGEGDANNAFLGSTAFTVSDQTLEFYAECSPSSDFTVSVQNSGWTTETDWTFTVDPDATYYYRVKARRGANESPWSNLESSLQDLAPEVSSIANQNTLEDAASMDLAFTINDTGTFPDDLVLDAESSNQDLVSDANLVITGSGAARTLSIQTTGNQSGSATITVTVTDEQNISTTSAFTLTTTAVNDAPSFTKGADVQAAQNAGAQTVTGWATAISPGPSESAQTVDFIVTPDPSYLFASGPAIDAAGNLTFTPATGRRGTAIVSVQLHDNGGTDSGGSNISASQTFQLTIGLATDDDRDAMPDDFESAYGLTDPDADGDGDGFTNLEEYRCGTHPNSSADYLCITDTWEDGTTFKVRFRSVPGKLYRVDRNDDFPTGDWNEVQTDIPGTGSDVEITDSTTTGLTKGVYRVIALP
ncbi:MAG TPA: M6 family metalloprotease domain-containing protein [Candidatus Paceibacterota bacterium]|nr:M6 family metalloprotease domain-containing protein [Candidatus Paceibacterota bacterium]